MYTTKQIHVGRCKQTCTHTVEIHRLCTVFAVQYMNWKIGKKLKIKSRVIFPYTSNSVYQEKINNSSFVTNKLLSNRHEHHCWPKLEEKKREKE